MEGTSQAVLGSSDEWKVPASLSVFLKSEKNSALLYIGKGPEYRPFRDLRSVPYTVLRPFSYTDEPPNAGSDFRRDRYEDGFRNSGGFLGFQLSTRS